MGGFVVGSPENARGCATVLDKIGVGFAGGVTGPVGGNG